MITNSVAIVLKRFPYSESSIIARCFVREMGKVSFIVHGAHRKKSPMGSYFQPINCLDLVYKLIQLFGRYRWNRWGRVSLYRFWNHCWTSKGSIFSLRSDFGANR